MEKNEFVEKILCLTHAASIHFTERQASLCHEHIQLMLQWNRRLNLTRITNPEEILIKHLLDSLIPSRWLPQIGSALDVGTGPGFPGIPLRILQSGLDMVLLEAHRKKVSFLKVVLSKLSLDNIRALQGRWEQLERIDHPLALRRYDLVTMRAVRLEAEHIAVLAEGVLQPGGIFAWWAGPSADAGSHREDFSSLGEGTEMVFQGDLEYDLPSLSKPRRLLLWKKRG